MKRLLTFLAFFGIAGAAAGQGSFWVERGNWAIASGQSGCIASSGRALEQNHNPLGMLVLRRTGQDPALAVDAYFWPGALIEGADLTLMLAGANGAQVTLAARAQTDRMATGTATLDPPSLREMRGAAHIQVSAGSQPRFLVQMDPPLGSVLADLSNCIRLVEK